MGSRFSLAFSLLICVLLAACGSPEERAASYLSKAEALFEQEDYVTARIEAMNAAQIEPRNADVRFLLAKIEEREQNFRKAISHLQVAIDADPNHLESRIKLGNYYVLLKAKDLAIEQATVAQEQAPDSAEVRLLQARIDVLNEDMDAALIEVDVALAADPKLIEAIILKAGIKMANGDTDAAMQIVQDGTAAADDSGAKQLRQFRILLLRSAERYDDIETELKSLAADYPDEESFPLALAQFYVTQKRTDEAEEIYIQYVEKDPQDVKRRIEFVRFVGALHGAEAAENTLQGYVTDLPDATELQLALGQLYESLKNQEDALATYEKIAGAEPKSSVGLAARNRIALIRLQQQKPQEAKAVITAILNDEQANTDALMTRAAFSFAEKKFDDAVSDLRTVLRAQPDSERALLLLARSHSAGDSPELAQDAYRRLIELNPAHPAASTELAELLARGGDVQRAEEVLRKQLTAVPEDRLAASNLIQALLLQGDIEGAETQARSMLDFEDDTGLAEFQLGRVLQAKKSSQEAIDAYKAALEKSPQAPEPLQGLITILVNEGRSPEAVTYLRAHLGKYPTQVPPRQLLGAVYSQLQETALAIEQFEEIISLQPDNSRAYSSLAAMYPDDTDKRIAVYKRGVAANPKDVVSNLLLAGEYERTEQFENAIAVYEKILDNDATTLLAANNLAALLLDFRSDAESYARALELAKAFEQSTEAAILDTLGWAYYRTEDYTNSVRLLEAAVAANDKIGQLHYHLGMALLKVDRRQRGKDELEKSLSLAEVDFVGIEETRATLAEL